jgi:hypothetical protein
VACAGSEQKTGKAIASTNAGQRGLADSLRSVCAVENTSVELEEHVVQL